MVRKGPSLGWRRPLFPSDARPQFTHNRDGPMGAALLHIFPPVEHECTIQSTYSFDRFLFPFFSPFCNCCKFSALQLRRECSRFPDLTRF